MSVMISDNAASRLINNLFESNSGGNSGEGFSPEVAKGLKKLGIDPDKLLDLIKNGGSGDNGGDNNDSGMSDKLKNGLRKLGIDPEKLEKLLKGDEEDPSGLPKALADGLRALGIDPSKVADLLKNQGSGDNNGSSGGDTSSNNKGVPKAIALDSGGKKSGGLADSDHNGVADAIQTGGVKGGGNDSVPGAIASDNGADENSFSQGEIAA